MEPKIHSAAKRRFHWVLVLAFVFASYSPFISQGNQLYFIAINDTVLPVRSFTSPIWVDGFFYVPYTVFDQGSTGVSLGTSSTYQKSTSLVTVYTDTSTLIFDLEGGYCVNGVTQSVFQFRGVVENGIPYLPMTIVCNFFRISFSYHTTDHGNLVRLEKGSDNLNHARFLLENQQKIQEMYDDYFHIPEETSPQVEEAEEPEEEPLVDTPICLAFVMGEETLDFADLLDSRKVHGLFLFTEQQLQSQGAYLRKLLSQGHSIGFSLQSTDLSQAREEIQRCNLYLRQQTGRSSLILWGNSGLKTSLEGEGYVFWQGGQAKSAAYPESLVSSLPQGGSMVYVTLEHSETTQRTWSQLMNLLGEGQFIPQIPLETIL